MSDNAPQVICAPIQPSKLSYSDYDPDNPKKAHCVSVDDFTTYSFPENSIIRPLRLEVNDRNSVRGDMPARVCVLESNRTTLKTFAFPSAKS